MQFVRLSDVKEIPVPTATPVPGWTGGPVARTRTPISPENNTGNFNASVVHFGKGATTGWHVHSSDQLLIVTKGEGIVATEKEQHDIKVGDVALVSAGERHWHGSRADSTLSHITITLAEGRSSR